MRRAADPRLKAASANNRADAVVPRSVHLGQAELSGGVGLVNARELGGGKKIDGRKMRMLEQQPFGTGMTSP